MHVHKLDPKQEPNLIYPLGDEMKKRERFFLKPIGGKLGLPFKNEGKFSMLFLFLIFMKYFFFINMFNT